MITDKLPKRFTSLNLTIVESKELKFANGTKAISPYCFILLDDVKVAKSRERNTENGNWEESFTVDEMCPHWSKLRVALFNSDKVKKDAHIGFVTINLDNILHGQTVDQWFSVYQLSVSDHQDQNMQSVGSLRLKLYLKTDMDIRDSELEKWKNVVIEPTYTSVRCIWKSISADRNEFAKSFTTCVVGLKCYRDTITTLINDDIENTSIY